MDVMCNNDESQKHHNIDHYTFFSVSFFFSRVQDILRSKRKRKMKEKEKGKKHFTV